ncbi:MAG: ABC transporter substrate-binding protein [Planctomycetota bacterium]
MQNGFGLKDLVVITLLVLVLGVVTLAIFAEDRRWEDVQDTAAKIDEIEQQIVRLEQRLADRPVVVRQPVVPGAPVLDGGGLAGPTWAKDGFEVTFSEPWDFSSNPYNQQGFRIGGEFREIYEGQPPKITPFTYADVYGRRVVDLVCESLGWYDPRSLEMRGRLAEAWQYDPNGEWLRVKIRDEARFSDGSPVLAEDVRWTYFDLIFNPEIEAERFRSVYNAIETITVIGDPETSRVLEFGFKEPRFDNVQQAFGFKILPKAIYEIWTESPEKYNSSTSLTVGSGPFKLERASLDDQWAPPEDIVLVRNEQYWGPRPPLDSYRIRSIRDSTARLVSYTNGEADMMRAIPTQFVEKRSDPEFLEDHDARDWYNMRGGYGFMAWQCGKRNGERLTPFHDKRVRQAMTLLTDRERLLRDISKNLARLATGPFLSSTPQANPDIEPWPHDPSRGQELLQEAGWWDRDGDGLLENERGDEFVFEITFGQGNESTLQRLTFLQSEYAKAGIKMELKPIDWSVLADILNRRDFDAITFAWSASAPENDPEQIWHSKSIDNQGDNFIQWANADADRLIEQGRATLDTAERMRVWHQLHEVFHEEQPYTYLFEVPWLRFTTRRSGNIEEYNSGLEYYEFWVGRESLPSNN